MEHRVFASNLFATNYSHCSRAGKKKYWTSGQGFHYHHTLERGASSSSSSSLHARTHSNIKNNTTTTTITTAAHSSSSSSNNKNNNNNNSNSNSNKRQNNAPRARATGENTLEAQLVRVLMKSIVACGGEFSAVHFCNAYVKFMTTPGSHNDTYASTAHRQVRSAVA